jgi:hypothetical protein
MGCYDTRKSSPNQLKPKIKERKMFTNRLSSLSGSQIQRGMSHTRSVRLLLVSVIALFAVVAPQTALAATPPQMFPIHEEGSELIDCGSFTAQRDYDIDQNVTFFYDQTGTWIKLISHFELNDVYTNLSTGFTLLSPGKFTFTLYPQDGNRSLAGVLYHITIPGIGIAVIDAGKVRIDEDGVYFSAGPHDPFNDQICAALS